MKITISRDDLLAPLAVVHNVVERRQTLPILGNILINITDNQITFTATDMEVEIVASIENPGADAAAVTLPARKLWDICRALPADATITIKADEKRATVTAGKSRFSLSTLPATDFPNLGDFDAQLSVDLETAVFKELIDRTQFAMAHQDVRYYLNGLLLEFSSSLLRGVATDGHRLAMFDAPVKLAIDEPRQVIVPRKGVAEIARLLDDSEGKLSLGLSSNHLQILIGNQRLTTKLIDGKFPDYERVLPQASDKLVSADRETLRQGLARTSILSNEKFRGVRLSLAPGALKALAHNPDQEEAEEEMEVDYAGGELEIGFNVSYLLDVVSAIQTDTVEMELSDANSSCLIRGAKDTRCKYVVMPMRL